jgi:hypothetical protein
MKYHLALFAHVDSVKQRDSLPTLPVVNSKALSDPPRHNEIFIVAQFWSGIPSERSIQDQWR